MNRLSPVDLTKEELLSTIEGLNLDHRDFCFIHLGSTHCYFLRFRNGEMVSFRETDFGVNSLIHDHIRHETPSEAEIEYTITEIEEKLMADPALRNPGECLISSDLLIAEALQKNSSQSETFTTQQVEEVFTEYALLSMGRSPVLSRVEMDQHKYIGILILREIMHHLYYDEVIVL